MVYARNAFVLMPFNPAFDEIYMLGIRETCDELGWECSRVDDHSFSASIIERIYEQIDGANLIIADMTGKNANVFYEVGYAHAKNKRVILLAQCVDDIPFDLKGHRHVIYEGDIAKLKKDLRWEVMEVLAANPFKDFQLDNLRVYSAEANKERPVVVDNFISLEGGTLIPMHTDLVLQVPGEISNYGKGIFFDFAVIIRNESRFLIDLSGADYRISFPEGVTFADDSLKLGHGKLAQPQNDGSFVIGSEIAGTVLEPTAMHVLMFHLRTTAAERDRYLTKVPVTFTLSRMAEWFSSTFFVEFAPLRRMN